jgi:hypothetical protein
MTVRGNEREGMVRAERDRERLLEIPAEGVKRQAS